MRLSCVISLLPAFVLASWACAQTSTLDIPPLARHERSDWINVRTDVAPAVGGDGQADDTAAIQAALDSEGDGKTIYLPSTASPGRLSSVGRKVGCLLVGHGRDTRLILAGHFWYNTQPLFALGPAVTLTLLGNRDVPDVDVNSQAIFMTCRSPSSTSAWIGRALP